MRWERDSLGEVAVAEDKYYGAQTERSRLNFAIGQERIPWPLIEAYAFLKKAAASVNCEFGLLERKKKETIATVCDEIIQGALKDHFPLLVWQTGSGTQTNMNVNEVISNRAIEILGGQIGSKFPIHPNDDVNKSQSSNDTFPSAMYIAASLRIKSKLINALQKLIETFDVKAKDFDKIVKSGRTHLMDATPISLGQEFSAFSSQIKAAKKNIEFSLEALSELAIGGTAVGTGLNAPAGFDQRVCEVLSEYTRYSFRPALNKFSLIAAHDAILAASGSLKHLAAALLKIVNDIRWLASGPRCGLAELRLPANEPGSSIMPGKVNPTQCEALSMVLAQVFGNDASIAFAASQGNLQLNTYKPLMIYNLLQSIDLLSDGILSFKKNCLEGLLANEKNIQKHLSSSLMLATVLNREIGYDKVSEIVKKADREDLSLKQAALDLRLLSEEQFDAIIKPEEMLAPFGG